MYTVSEKNPFVLFLTNSVGVKYIVVADLAELLEVWKYKAAECSQLSYAETHTLRWQERLINKNCIVLLSSHIWATYWPQDSLTLWLSQTIGCYLQCRQHRRHLLDLQSVEFVLYIYILHYEKKNLEKCYKKNGSVACISSLFNIQYLH